MYIATSFIIFFFSLLLFDCDRKSVAVKVVFTILLLFIICQDGFRWQVGTDWDPYYNSFKLNAIVARHEIGYSFLMSFVRSITDKYTIFLLLIALIHYYAYAILLKNFSINPLISLCMMYCGAIPLMGMNRQFLALSFAVISIEFIFAKKIIPFLLLLFCASCFHKTAIFFFPAYFLLNIHLEKKQVFFIAVTSFILGFIGIINFLPIEIVSKLFSDELVGQMNGYLMSNSSFFSISGSIYRIIMLILYSSIKVPLEHKQKYDFFFILYLISVVMYFLFVNSPLNIIAGRGASYFSLSGLILIAYFIKYISQDRFKEMLCWFIFFAINVFIMEKGIAGYAQNLGKDIFNPYQCVLFPEGLF